MSSRLSAGNPANIDFNALKSLKVFPLPIAMFYGIRYGFKQSGCHLGVLRVEENMFSRSGGDMNERGISEIYVESAFSYT